MEPFVFIGKVATGNGNFIVTTDASKITSDQDIYVTMQELAYLAAIKSEQQLEWHAFYDLIFWDKVDYAKFRRLWQMKPLENLVSCECNKGTRDYLQYHGYKLPADTRIFA
jgi:hypothetical protein